MLEALLFFAKFAGCETMLNLTGASGLHVQHFVKQNVFHAQAERPGVHAAIQQNLIGRIVTPELPAPASRAPTNVRAL